NFRSANFILQSTDSLMIEKYASINELNDDISAVPYDGGNKEKILKCYNKAVEINLSDPDAWYIMGIKLVADDCYNEAYNSFSKALDTAFAIHFASLVWMGHLNDLKNKREEAIAMYRKALDAYPGFPVQHDQWKIVIDRKWIEERMRVPFRGVK
ncbi:MAG: tetratricopeptide repeat protein, partial [Methanococcaceae archaeon]